jgi:capping protein beta
MVTKYKHEEKIYDPKKAIINLTKILSVNESTDFNLNIIPFFLRKEERKDVFKRFPIPFSINNSDKLGPFIESEFNKDDNSYRSPWSNQYFPPFNSDKTSIKLLPKELRELEERLNKLIKLYLKLYYSDDAISSAYISFQDESISNGFNCCVLIKGRVLNSEYLKDTSFLESTNIISVKFMRERAKDTNVERIKVIYKTNTIFLFKLELKELDNCCYNGTKNCECIKTTYADYYFDYDKHLKHIGSSIEENEGILRTKIDEIYLDKNDYICKEIRTEEGQDGETISKIKNLKNICSEYEKYINAKKMQSMINEKKNKY